MTQQLHILTNFTVKGVETKAAVPGMRICAVQHYNDAVEYKYFKLFDQIFSEVRVLVSSNIRWKNESQSLVKCR